MKNQLDEDSIRRLDKNPLRILDSKNPDMQALIAEAPVMLDYLDEPSAEHFDGLKSLLTAAGVPFEVNPRLVRGLDYYNLTVFEWITDALGSQGAVCAGGRYDGLVEKLGGRPTPAIGWAMGVERLIGLYEACGGAPGDAATDIYIVAAGDGAFRAGLAAAEQLRDGYAGRSRGTQSRRRQFQIATETCGQERCRFRGCSRRRRSATGRGRTEAAA